ncbi:hypothetical protein P5673_031437 [Acropora cervicornis]|uniref:Uncharacterized protein n=1 Tax=Acropora cervicornis TaxID=6130 RepID=A0AAD9PSR2_ACRCE|nr:hypothetical protein P5673_031437 [Acropora cervicornis]
MDNCKTNQHHFIVQKGDSTCWMKMKAWMKASHKTHLKIKHTSFLLRTGSATQKWADKGSG